ncbi:MAG TPA: adenylate/guanylate cyclase domain-containing protein [Stellaceae bacterium]|nr:adenylate/guanylate cyclase domain-containing protein [Stellaceae bacterium]
MSLSSMVDWPALARRGPSIVRRFRLASGLVLFTYVFLHFVNHSLGNISVNAMESGATIQEWIWRSAIGTVALYGGFAIHFSLAFWAIYTRRSLRMGWIEALRLALGLSIPLLVLQHALGVRFGYSYFGVHLIYRHVLFNIWMANPYTAGLRQLAIFVVAWLHGCIGLYLWLRVKRHFHRFAPYLLIAAVLLPTTALLGAMQGARQVEALIHADPAFLAALRQTGYGGGPPGAQAMLWTIALWCWAGYAAALALIFGARGIRTLVERRGGTVRIAYPDGRRVRVPKGLSVLDASRRAGIPHASVCGGRARCTTCRVRVLVGLERLPPPSPAEIRVLAPLGADRAVRLACQLKPMADISIWPLLPPEITVRDQDRLSLTETGAERFVAILFVDIRSSTQLVESRLPYDVVFILNRFFEAVGSAIIAAGGKPNQFIGDGMMAIFGTDTDAAEACRQALEAARLIDWHLAEMNRALANELQRPIGFGIGVHAGEVIIGTMGYREHAQMTAIGEAVHVASRLQDLTKEYRCQLVVSEVVGTAAGIPLGDFPSHEIQVRGLSVPLTIRAIDSAAMLPSPGTETEEDNVVPIYARST